MGYLASRPGLTLSASEIGAGARLPVPTVSKLLQLLAKGGLVESHRGARGGYSLAVPADRIPVSRVIEAIEGPIALTACTIEASEDCGIEEYCQVRAPWRRINRAIRGALEEISLAEMTADGPAGGSPAPSPSTPAFPTSR